MARRTTADDARVGIALLRLSDAQPTRWQHLGDYGVSTGTSCFADPDALDALDRRSAAFYDQPGALEGEEPLVDAIASSDALLYDVDAQHHLAAFTSGTGDGVYGAWAGLDEAGRPCVLLTSFDTIAAETAPAVAREEARAASRLFFRPGGRRRRLSRPPMRRCGSSRESATSCRSRRPARSPTRSPTSRAPPEPPHESESRVHGG